MNDRQFITPARKVKPLRIRSPRGPEQKAPEASPEFKAYRKAELIIATAVVWVVIVSAIVLYLYG